MTVLPTFTTLGAGPTILMLHDIGGNHLAFAPQVENFAIHGYRAVAWDMPGYGRSAPVEPFNFKTLAQSCAALIGALRVDSVALIGHGMGGMVAQELVARDPALVSRLILCGAPARCRPPEASDFEPWRRELLALHCAPLDAGMGMAEFAQVMVPRWIGPGSLPEGVQLATRCMAEVSPAIWRRAWEASAEFDRSGSLELIRVPTLLIAGEHDREAPPELIAHMADRIDGSSFAELRGTGHLMQLEAPEQFDALVLDFMAQPLRLAGSSLH